MKHEKIDTTGAQPLSRQLNRVESLLETFLFTSRWLMAPFYVLMVGALGLLLVKFA